MGAQGPCLSESPLRLCSDFREWGDVQKKPKGCWKYVISIPDIPGIPAFSAAAAAAKSLQSYPTLCDLKDGSPPGSPVPEILQARTLEWVAISFSNA